MMWTDDPEISPEEYPERVSKSQLKRESAALQDLGQELIGLSREQLERLDLPAELMEAVRLGQSITERGALKRQRKYIGKVLRNIDAEFIQAGLAALKNESAEAVHRQHVVERWRDRMLAEGDAAVNEFLEANPGADRQKLRQLTRDARRERDAAAAPRSARLLFRYLREVLE
ncbi:ribosome biogenesis factor YjgA [Methylocaldum sp.]|uniref:ribosome biogenesis factor YjgA n=1 Tax=Methylocaldum sp. TaxID=1969727 RepID=UPI002D5F68F5|nr:ribosome biogenesis factor YjgA [Methylocaldum sp.]HYE37585.1 ribosome biogenesis factor YjgA [Methylocaldum sp.]